MARKFGIITTVDGAKIGMLITSITTDESVQTAEQMNGEGKITDIAAYGRATDLNVAGALDVSEATPIRAGSVLAVEGVDYMINSKNKTEDAANFAQASLAARTAEGAVMHPIVEPTPPTGE